MFETIFTLITIVLWAAAIFLFGGGLFLCFSNLFKGKGWEKFWAIVAMILGVIVFNRLYAWLDSIVWCLILTGMVIAFVADIGSNKLQPAPVKEKGPSLTDAIVDTYCEYELTKAAVKDAIRESKE